MTRFPLWLPSWPVHVVTVADSQYHPDGKSISAAAAPGLWLRQHYDGGGILLDDASNPDLIHAAGIDMREYYLSGPLQNQAVADPARFAKWVVLAPPVDGVFEETDNVSAALWGTSALKEQYKLVYSSSGYQFYMRIGPPSQ